MQFSIREIKEIKDLAGKKVIVRVDCDIDIENEKIIDDTRLLSSLSTLDYLLEKGATVIIIGHLGRPHKKFKIHPPDGGSKFKISKVKEFSLETVAKWFQKKYKGRLIKTGIGDFSGWRIKNNLFILENIRFYEGEEENSPEFAKRIAGIGEVFINEAFAVSHRRNASVDAITKFLPSYAGFHLVKEVEILSNVIENPRRPLVVLIGGAKIETKLPLVEKMHHVADYVLVGGEIAEQDNVLIKVQHEKINPVKEGRKPVVFIADVKKNKEDITDKSIENFEQIINIAGTIVWNGPVGLINQKSKIPGFAKRSGAGKDQKQGENTERGTRELAETIVKSKAYKVVGGGDTLAYLKRIGLLSRFDFVSTGGGAMLEFLSGKKLPGITPLLK